MQQLHIDWTLANAAGVCIRKYGVKAAGFRSLYDASPALVFGAAHHKLMEHCALDRNLNVRQFVDRELAASLETFGKPYTLGVLYDAPDNIFPAMCNIIGADEENLNYFPEQKHEVELDNNITYSAKIDLRVNYDDLIWFIEHKTSKYGLGMDGVTHYMLGEGQTKGQLLLGHRLYGDRFQGVLILHYNISKEILELVMVTYNPRQVHQFEENLYNLAPRMRDAAAASELYEEMNYSSCRVFKNSCNLYDLCHKSKTLSDLSRDKWIAGIGWESELP